MIKSWFAICNKTGEMFEATEPISFRTFLIESHILNDFATNYTIFTNRKKAGV